MPWPSLYKVRVMRGDNNISRQLLSTIFQGYNAEVLNLFSDSSYTFNFESRSTAYILVCYGNFDPRLRYLLLVQLSISYSTSRGGIFSSMGMYLQKQQFILNVYSPNICFITTSRSNTKIIFSTSFKQLSI